MRATAVAPGGTQQADITGIQPHQLDRAAALLLSLAAAAGTQ